MERYFVIIGRINSILFLLVLLGAAASVSWLTFTASQSQRRGVVEVVDADSAGEAPVLLGFERIESILGADALMMRLTTQGKSGKFSSGGYGGETRNVLFLSGSDKVSRWLFKDHKNLILVSTQLNEESSSPMESPTKALYFEYVVADTNNDETLSSEDNSSVGLAKPDGSGFIEILGDVSRVLLYDVTDQENLSVVYQKGTVVRLAKYSLRTMSQLSDQQIVNVPSSL